MLLSMKAHVEGMRALLYFTGFCVDKAKTSSEPEQIETWSALRDMLMPVCRVYTADAGFRVAETAVQVHGRYGYFKGSPVEQFIRDIKINSIWELTTGIHSLIFVAQTMPRREGKNFAGLLERMEQTIETYGSIDVIRDLAKGGMTMILATHQIGFTRSLADEVLFMEKGSIIEQGSPEDLLSPVACTRSRDFCSRLNELYEESV